jgi:hypothetical protein
MQQSRYSLCVQLEIEQRVDHPYRDYRFLPHNDVLVTSVNNDLIVKILIPASERKLALKESGKANTSGLTPIL